MYMYKYRYLKTLETMESAYFRRAWLPPDGGVLVDAATAKRGSVNCVVRRLWSTKYGRSLALYRISQPA